MEFGEIKPVKMCFQYPFHVCNTAPPSACILCSNDGWTVSGCCYPKIWQCVRSSNDLDSHAICSELISY